MPRVESTVEIDVPIDVAFRLSQTYGALRYRWDPFVREQHLLDGAASAARGVRTSTTSRHGLHMISEYVSYRPPTQVGMKMVTGPWFFEQMSGGWSFAELSPARTRATWRYTFSCRPRWLRPIADPVGRRLLGRDIDRRLASFARACTDPSILAELDALSGPGRVLVREVVATDDLDALGRIVVSAYQALAGRPEDPEYDVELADVAGRVADAVVFGAFDGDGTPLGCVTYVADASSPYAERLDDGEASFRMLAVDLAAQGRGVGEALVIACVERARADGRAAVFFHSGDWMATAHRLYARLGFTRVPERDWTDGMDLTLLGFRQAL